MSEPTRYRVANNQAQLTLGGGILAVDHAGPLVMYDDYARLKADAQLVVKHLGEACADNLRLKADVNELAEGLKLASEVGIKIADEVTRLKAEVERLNTGIQPEGSNDAVGRAVNVLLEKEKEIASLKAEVERLAIQRAKLIKSAEELFRFIGAELYGPIDHFEADWEAAKGNPPGDDMDFQEQQDIRLNR